MLSYEIIIHCICGKVERYILDAIKCPIAIIGRKDESLKYQHIGLCADDGPNSPFLSSTELYFAYDIKRKDWVVGNGFPNKDYWNYDKNINELDERTKNKRINNQVYVFDREKFEKKLNSEIKERLGEERPHRENPYAESFTEIKENNTFNLKTISGVGIFPVNYPEKDIIKYNKKHHEGINIILLPKIPFHWYIEVNENSTNRDAIVNNIEKTNYLSEYIK